jgi:type II secretory pathway pseudopilin PulG
MNSAGQVRNRAAGYAMAALLVAIAVMAVGMTVALTAWRQAMQREREAELVFRGQQYVRALQLYQRKFAAAYAPSIDLLVTQKFLRKKYKDPMVEDGEFEVLYQGSQVRLNAGQGQVISVGQQGQGQGGPTPALTFDSQSGASTLGTLPTNAGGPRGGVIGVRSRSTAESIRIYNGGTHYNEWLFVFNLAATGRGQARPGLGTGPGGPRGGPGMPPRGGRGFN